MSDRESVPPAEAVEDFLNLYPRQTGLGVYRVLHVQEDDTSTHYKVNINDGTCECEDFQMRGKADSGKACKHLVAAIYQAKKHISAEDVAVNNIAGVVRDAQQSVQELERIATGVKADVSHAAAESATDDADDEPDADPVAAVEDWLADQGVDVDKLDVWDQGGSVQIESQEKLDDDEFAVLRDTDWIWYDGDENRNFVTEDNLTEAMG